MRTIMRTIARQLRRIVGVGAGFLLTLSFVVFLLFALLCFCRIVVVICHADSSSSVSEPSILIDEIVNYQNEHSGKLPNSLLEISKTSDDRFGSDYIVVNPNGYRSTTAQLSEVLGKFRSFFGLHADDALPSHEPYPAIIARRLPSRSLLPFPFAVHTTFHPDPAICNMDAPLSPSCFRSLCDWDSRKLSAWAAEQTDSTNQPLRRYRFAASFIPDVLYYLALVGACAMLLRRSVRAKRTERLRYDRLKALGEALSGFFNQYGRFPVSEGEFRSETDRDPDAFGLGTSFQYLGDLPLKYDGTAVVADTSESWLAPSWPFFGGKRFFLLLEDGRIVKLRGDSSVRKFSELAAEAQKRFRVDFDQPLSSSFFNDASTVVAPTPSTKRSESLEMKKETIIVRIVKPFFPPAILGLGVLAAAIAVFTSYRILTLDCASPDAYTQLGLTLAFFGLPYWIFVSNYFAEY